MAAASDFNPYYAPPGSRQPPGYDPSWSRSPYFSLAGEDPGPDPWQRNELVQQQAAQQRQQQQPAAAQPAAQSTDNSIIGNPLYSLQQLGAAATGQQMVVNPTPGQQNIDPKSGVYSGAQTPLVSSSVPKAPKGPWSNIPGLMGTQAVAKAPTTAWTPGAAFGSQPVTPATAAPVQAGRPWAAPQGSPGQMWAAPPAMQAPSAPGIVPPMITGGEPSAWGIPGGQPAAMPTGRTTIGRTGSIVGNGSANMGPFGSGPVLGAATALGTQKLQQGGSVPGRGSQDTVPAMLTPGEFVVNKQAVQNIGVDKLNQLNTVQHFQSGGSVRDPDPDSQYFSWKQLYQRYSPQGEVPKTIPFTPAQPGGHYTSEGYYVGPGSSPGTSGYIYTGGPGTTGGQQPIGAGQPITSQPSTTQQVGSAMGSIGSGLMQLGQQQSESAKKLAWTPQPSHIPDPSTFQRQYQYNLKFQNPPD